MVPSEWDSAPTFVCGPNFTSDLIGKSPIGQISNAGPFDVSNVATFNRIKPDVRLDMFIYACMCMRA